MAGQKFYAVKKGRVPGIYFNWSDCEMQVKGYSDAQYKSFSSVVEAKDYVMADEQTAAPEQDEPAVEQTADSVSSEMRSYDTDADAIAFVDGSYNSATGVYGYGGFLLRSGRRILLEGSGSDKSMASMRNVAGEIEGAMAAVNEAELRGAKKLLILYDYSGIESWATMAWKANSKETQRYRDFMNRERNMKIEFRKVAAHTGIEGNEMADVTAKHAVGMELSAKEQALYDKLKNISSRSGLDVSVLGIGEGKEDQFGD